MAHKFISFHRREAMAMAYAVITTVLALISLVNGWEIALTGPSAPLCNGTISTTCGCMKELYLENGCRFYPTRVPDVWRVGSPTGGESLGRERCGLHCLNPNAPDDPIPGQTQCTTASVSGLYGQYSCGRRTLDNGTVICDYYRIMGTIRTESISELECAFAYDEEAQYYSCLPEYPILRFTMVIRNKYDGPASTAAFPTRVSAPLRRPVCESEKAMLETSLVAASERELKVVLPNLKKASSATDDAPGFTNVAFVVKDDEMGSLRELQKHRSGPYGGIEWIDMGASYQCPNAEHRYRPVPFFFTS